MVPDDLVRERIVAVPCIARLRRFLESHRPMIAMTDYRPLTGGLPPEAVSCPPPPHPTDEDPATPMIHA